MTNEPKQTDNDKLLDDYSVLCIEQSPDSPAAIKVRKQILARMGAVAEAKPAVDWAAHRATVEDYYASGSRIAAAILALIDAEAARAAKDPRP